jgi:hypothetical protein
MSSENGKIFIYDPKEDKFHNTITIANQSQATEKLALVNNNIWATTKNEIHVFEVTTKTLLKSFVVDELNGKTISHLGSVLWSFKDDFHVWIFSGDSDCAVVYNGLHFNKLKVVRVGSSSNFMRQVEDGKIYIAKDNQKINEWIYL